jgi:hypothetical protein
MFHKNTVVPGHHPEAELLLCCARTCVDTEQAKRIRTLARENLDWEYIVRMSLMHGVMPLLYRSLKSSCPEAVPKATLNELREHFQYNARHSFLLTSDLLKLLDLFETHGINAIPFKGPVLAASVYRNLLLRQFRDLDVLVHKRDYVKAKDLLIAQGYRPWQKRSEAEEKAHLQSQHAFVLVRGDGKVKVDLHWGISQSHYSFPLDPECLWGRLEPISLGGRTVLNLAPEDLLVILCMHGSKHCWERLGWICDVAELIRTQRRMDWDRIMEEAGRLNSQRMLILGVHLASDLLGATLPEKISRRANADPVVKSLALHVRERIFSNEVRPPNYVESVNRKLKAVALHLRMRERIEDKVLYLIHELHKSITPNARDRSLLPLPPILFFLYYALRPIRLIATYVSTLMRRAYNGDVYSIGASRENKKLQELTWNVQKKSVLGKGP